MDKKKIIFQVGCEKLKNTEFFDVSDPYVSLERID